MKKSLWFLIILLTLGARGFGATLQRSQILSVSWGKAAGEIGRDLSKGPDDTDAGPVDFYVDPARAICIADIFNHRVVVFDKDGKFQRLIDLPGGKNDTIESISADDQTIYALDLRGPGKPNSYILSWDASSKLVQDIFLKPLGIGLPLYFERTSQGDFFIQDNMTFDTWHLDAEGKVLDKTPDDDRLMTLTSQGHYRFDVKGPRVQVLTKDNRPLTYYWGGKGFLQILGVDSAGALYVVYDKGQGNFGFDRLTPDGGSRETVTIKDAFDKKLLDPDRFTSDRPGRIAPDGTLYIMGEPTDSTFKIYAYVLSPG
jgi:hypothetical protein